MAPRPLLLSHDAVAARGIHIKPSESAFRENSATIVMPSSEAAFLNPVQEFNRDLSTLAISTWSERLNEEKRLRFDERMKARAAKQARRGEPDAKRARTEVEGDDAKPRAFKPYTFTALEALAATGLRSIRYAREIPLLRYVALRSVSNEQLGGGKRPLSDGRRRDAAEPCAELPAGWEPRC